MKLADITSELLHLFAGQDADCGGAIVVWHDPSGEFEDVLADLELPDGSCHTTMAPPRGWSVCYQA